MSLDLRMVCNQMVTQPTPCPIVKPKPCFSEGAPFCARPLNAVHVDEVGNTSHTQPCAEQRKSLVEQTEEITVELLLESNDIQLFGNKLRFLVAPQNERELQQCNSFFITLCICSKTVGRNSTPDYAAGQTIRPRKRFPAFRSGSRKKYEGKTGIGLNDYFCIGTNRRKHEKTLDRLHRITYRRPDRIPLHPLLLRLRRGRQKRRVELCRL